MLEGGFEWRCDLTIQELMQEIETDLIFQKHKKISTPTAKCSGGFLKGFTELSLTEFLSFRRISTLLMQTSGSEHKAGIKQSERIKSSVGF